MRQIRKGTEMKKGARVICSIYGEEVARVNQIDYEAGLVHLRYKGSRCEWTAYLGDCERVKN